MFEKVKSLFKDESIKVLGANFFSLFVLKGFNYLLPLLIFPYLIRVLGVEKFGLVAFSQSLIMYFVIFVDFGFSLSAVKEVSVFREDKQMVEEIFSSVIIIKFFILVISLLILLFLVSFVPKFKKEALFHFLMFGFVVGQAFFPVWFFQGMERMKYITILDVLGKIFFTVLVFLFIKDVGDYILVALFYGVSSVLVGIIAFVFALRVFKIRLKFPSLKSILFYFRKTLHFFLSRVSVSLYTNSNTFVIGLALGNEAAGMYAAAEKIFFAASSLYQPLTNALYPFMAKTRNKSFFKNLFKWVVVFNLFVFGLIFLLSPHIITLVMGTQYPQTVAVLRILSLTGVFIVPAVLIGYPYLAAFGYEEITNNSVIIASVFHVMLLMVFMPWLSIYLVAFFTIVTQLIVLGIRLYGIKRI